MWSPLRLQAIMPPNFSGNYQSCRIERSQFLGVLEGKLKLCHQRKKVCGSSVVLKKVHFSCSQFYKDYRFTRLQVFSQTLQHPQVQMQDRKYKSITIIS